MKKLANALETFGWLGLVIGILVGVCLTSGARHLDEIFVCLAAGAAPGVLILLLCLAHKHYLTVAENLNNYLMTKAQPMPGAPVVPMQPPAYDQMPPSPQPFPAQFAPQAPVAPQQPMPPMQPVQPPVQTPPQQ